MRNKFLFPFFIIGLLFSSCTTDRFIYTASPPNNPYFTKKGESKLTAYYSESNNNKLTNEYAGGFDLQAAYAVTNNFAVTLAYLNRKERDVYEDFSNFFNNSVVKYKRNLVDIGGGFFLPLNPKKTITFNMYGGVAFGKFSLDDNGLDKSMSTYYRYDNNNITKFFLQPSFNFMPGRYIRLSVILKVSFVHYGNNHTTYTPEELSYFSLDRLSGNTLSFLEPAFNFQFGLPQLKWIKLDFTNSSVSNPALHNLNVRRNNASIGLTFDFSKMKKSNN